MIVLGAQQSNSAIQIHGSILPQTPLPSRLSNNIEQSYLCTAVGPCWLYIFKHSCVYISIPNSLTIPSLYPFPLGSISSFSKSVSLCFVNEFICICIFIFYISCVRISYNVSPSLRPILISSPVYL